MQLEKVGLGEADGGEEGRAREGAEEVAGRLGHLLWEPVAVLMGGIKGVAGAVAEGCGAHAGVDGGERSFGIDAVGDDAEHVAWAGFDVREKLLVDFFDGAHAVLEEYDGRLSREAVFDGRER